MSEFGISNNHQLDMFDPLHIALKKEAQSLQDSIQPTLNKIRELTVKAVEVCPHENITRSENYYDDEYGRYSPDSTEVVLTCDFCKKQVYYPKPSFIQDARINRDIFVELLRKKDGH